MIKENPDRVEHLLSLMNIGRNLERIADCATNIAEDIVYLIEGDIVRHGGGANHPRPQQVKESEK